MEKTVFNCPHCGKIIHKEFINGKTDRPTVTCPDCGSQRNFKNGLRQTGNGKIQCYLCRDCGHRFS